jgi:DNA-binding transcriptional regulator YiaG
MKAYELTKLKERKHMTQESMSKWLCISKRAFQAYEQGTRKIPGWLVELIRLKCAEQKDLSTVIVDNFVCNKRT